MALRLETFQTEAPATATTVVTDLGAIEQARLAAYEQGYTAGWDDGVAAQADDQTRLRADLARSLQSLAFTYHEAQTHILRGLEPLLAEMVGRLLPDVARASFGAVVVEALRPLAAAAAGQPVTVIVNPAARAAVEAALPENSALPVVLLEEASLGEGLAVLRLAATETRIDLDGALARIAEAVRSFFELSLTETCDG